MDLRKTWDAYKALEAKFKKLKADNKELAKAKQVLMKERDARATEKKALEEEVNELKSAMVPDEEKPEDVKGLTTRTQLLAGIQQGDDDALMAT